MIKTYLNKVTQGDCYKLIKELPDNSIDCIYTDIPYLYVDGGVGKVEMGARMKALMDSIEAMGDGIDWSILTEFKRVLKHINIFIWCSRLQLADILSWGKDYNTELLVWCKTNPSPTVNNNWLPDLEYCVYMREKGVPLNDGYENKSKWYISATNKADKDMFSHPTIKPLPLVKRHLLHATQPNDIILDPFIGSGTTAVACVETQRQFIGFEIEKKWCDVANDRLNKTDSNGQISLFLR